MENKPLSPAEGALLFMMLIAALILVFSLIGVDLIHQVGNLLRWLNWV